MLVAETVIISLLPSVGRFLPGGAQASIYRDTSIPHLLPMPAGIGLFAAWILAAAWLATRLVERRDLA